MELLFAKRLKELRQEKGFSQVALGERLGYGYTAISAYENGRKSQAFLISSVFAACWMFPLIIYWAFRISADPMRFWRKMTS